MNVASDVASDSSTFYVSGWVRRALTPPTGGRGTNPHFLSIYVDAVLADGSSRYGRTVLVGFTLKPAAHLFVKLFLCFADSVRRDSRGKYFCAWRVELCGRLSALSVERCINKCEHHEPRA